MPTILATLTGKRVLLKSRTSSTVIHPYKSKKKRDEEIRVNRIIITLNRFASEVRKAEKKREEEIKLPHGLVDRKYYWSIDISEIGEPMDSFDNIDIYQYEPTFLSTRAGEIQNTQKALEGFAKLKKELEEGLIESTLYDTKLINLYYECL